MLLELSSTGLALDEEACLSYFIRNKNRKAPRVANARLIDISEAGLCMEISPHDSDLFLESQGESFILSRDIEAQIFCRSHPINVSVAGCIKWFKPKKEIDNLNSIDDGNICVGVIFVFRNSAHKKDIVGLVRHLKNDTVHCSACHAQISADAMLCYNCGTRPVRKRTLLRKMLFSLLADSESAGQR